MSIKVMIVDDEKLERILIKKSFEWEENGFEIVGEADSGENAIATAKKMKPDIILTDINMPFMNGIELTTWLKEYMPDCKVIIITGYREFEYAQQAVKLGVKDFLLKPIQRKNIQEILYKLKQEMNESKKQQQTFLKLKSTHIENKEILVESFLQILIEGRVDKEEALEKIENYGLSLLLKKGICINIEGSEEIESKELIKYIQEIVNRPCEQLIFAHYMGNVILLLTKNKEEAKIGTWDNYLRKYTEALKEKIYLKSNIAVTIGVGTEYNDITEIAESYKNSLKGIMGSVIYGKGKIIYFSDLEQLQENSEIKSDIDLNDFNFCIDNQLQDKAFKTIDNYTALLKAMPNYSLDRIHLMSVNMISLLLTVLHHKGRSFKDLFETEQYVYEKLEDLKTIDEINTFLKDIVERTISYLASLKVKRGNKLIEQAQEFMDSHLYEKDLSLKKIAQYLYVNDSYLSRVFKKEVGESVIEYITKKRIQKGIELFNTTDLKAYEVAEKIGIEDPHYFGICFKKYTGQTIKQFKAQSI